MIWGLLRGLANVFLTLAFFAFCGWWLFIGYMDRLRRIEDPVYAMEYFEGILPVAEILESRKWHAKNAEPWDCTYAIARLTSEAPEHPPLRPYRNELGWQYEFGGDWAVTPAPELRDTTRNAVAFCAKYWPRDLAIELHSALAAPGAWFVRDAVGETLFIYAPKQRLAARIRFGD